MTQDISAQVREFVEENFLFGSEELSDTDSMLELGLIDSTGILELVAFLEGTFDIVMKDEEIAPENLDSLANITRFVAAKRAGAGVPVAPAAAA